MSRSDRTRKIANVNICFKRVLKKSVPLERFIERHLILKTRGKRDRR